MTEYADPHGVTSFASRTYRFARFPSHLQQRMRSCFVPSTAMTKRPRNRAPSNIFSRIMYATMSTSACSRTAVQPRER